MNARSSWSALVFGLLVAVGCSNSAARCDVDCTSDADCGAGLTCMDASGGTGRACLPSGCSACPIGDCELSADGCGFVRCTPAP